MPASWGSSAANDDGERLVKLVEATPLGATTRLAVVDFADKRLLIAVSRTGVQLISETQVSQDSGNHVS
jgi:flagellar biogenesis protein FliO